MCSIYGVTFYTVLLQNLLFGVLRNIVEKGKVSDQYIVQKAGRDLPSGWQKEERRTLG